MNNSEERSTIDREITRAVDTIGEIFQTKDTLSKVAASLGAPSTEAIPEEAGADPPPETVLERLDRMNLALERLSRETSEVSHRMISTLG